MDKPKKKKGTPRQSRYPYLSDAYPYEYELGMKNAREKAMNAFATLSPEQQEMYGSADVFANDVLQGLDYPVQMVDNNRSDDFNLKRTAGVNLLAGVPGAILASASVNPYVGNIANVANTVSNSAVGKPYYQTGLYDKMSDWSNGSTLASMGSILAPIIVANKLNPSRYQIKSREAIAPGLERMGDNALQNRGAGSYDHPFIPQADMSEYGFYPNAQEGAQVSDEMGGDEQEQQQAQLQQTIIKLIQQFKTPEAIQKYLIQQGIDRQSLSQVMMMVQQMMQGQEAQYEDGGMPAEIALARFKASGREKGLVGGELEAHVEKMKSRYGYQKGGAVKAEDVNPFDVRDMFESGGRVEYRGHSFPGYNKPIKAPAGDKHKKMVLVKRGDKIRLIKYGLRGMQDYTQHKDEKRRKNYLARSGGIKNKSGQLTKNDPFSANYWARRDLW